MIEVEGLTKRYGRHTAVDGISFKVQKGEILGFLGPNGAGKTTTMRVLTGYLPPTEGTARVAGFDVFSHPLEAKRRTGYLPETPPLYPDMDVVSFLDFVAKIKGIASNVRKTKVDDAMEKCRVTDVRQTLIGRLSKGYRQRVGLAQAILHNPDVLILDEPTAGLDPKQISETRDLIKGLGGEHTIVLSTHILHEVSVTCSRVLIINKGRVVAEDTPDNLAHRTSSAGTLRVEARGPSSALLAAFQAIPGILSVQHKPEGGKDVTVFEIEAERGRDVRADLARAVVQKDCDLLGLSQVSLGLEEIFLHLTATDAAEKEPTAATVAGEEMKA